MFWKLALQSSLKNSKRTYFYFGINSPKGNIATSIAYFLLSLSQLYWAVVLLQRDCLSEINYSPPHPAHPNPHSYCFVCVLDERADLGQNWRPRQTCAITACSECARQTCAITA